MSAIHRTHSWSAKGLLRAMRTSRLAPGMSMPSRRLLLSMCGRGILLQGYVRGEGVSNLTCVLRGRGFPGWSGQVDSKEEVKAVAQAEARKSDAKANVYVDVLCDDSTKLAPPISTNNGDKYRARFAFRIENHFRRRRTPFGRTSRRSCRTHGRGISPPSTIHFHRRVK